MGALEAPRDRHRQDHRTGTSRAEQMTEAMAVQGALEAMVVQGAQEAMAGGACGPYSRNPFYPPPQISLGKLGGIRSPPGLNTDTGQDSPPGLDTQDKTVPQEQEALLG